MTTNTSTDTGAAGAGTTGADTTSLARDEAARVASSAGEKASDVAQTAIEQTKEVATEAVAQAKNLAEELRGQVDEQAIAQRDRLVETLRSVGDDLQAMVWNSGQTGLARDLVSQVADRVQGAVNYLEAREPADYITDLKRFARRRPGAFLVGAAVAGMLAGRLTRGARSAASDSSTTDVDAAVSVPETTGAYTAGVAETYDTEAASGAVGSDSELAWSTSSAGLSSPSSMDYPSATSPYSSSKQSSGTQYEDAEQS